MLNRLLCLVFGHKKVKELIGKDPPISVGWGGNEFYPMWPCRRCKALYISEKTIRPNALFFGEIDQAAVEISNTDYDVEL